MQKLPKVSESDVKPEELLLAQYLIQHYRWSFDVRSEGELDVVVDPPEVRELLNVLMWVGKGFGFIDAGNHVIGLQDVIESSSKEMVPLISYIREFGANEPIVREVNFLQEQMEAADTLMGYITDA